MAYDPNLHPIASISVGKLLNDAGGNLPHASAFPPECCSDVCRVLDDELLGFGERSMLAGSITLLGHCIFSPRPIGEALQRALAFLRIFIRESAPELRAKGRRAAIVQIETAAPCPWSNIIWSGHSSAG